MGACCAAVPKPIQNTNKPIKGSSMTQEGLERAFMQAIVDKDPQIEHLMAKNQDSDDEDNPVRISNIATLSPKSVGLSATPIKTKHKTFKSTQLWNPALLMIAYDLEGPLTKLLAGPHRSIQASITAGLFAKPYDQERAWTLKKRINRESFALKLAIYNKSESMLKLLISGVGPSLWQCWNVGHMMEALRQIVKTNWVAGLEVFMK